MIGLRKIDSGALAEEVRSMGRAKPLKEAAEGKKGTRFGGRRLREGLKIISDFNSYTPWSHADATYSKIATAGKLGELEDWLEEMYPEGITKTELNDLLWFDADEVLRAMGLSDEDADDDDDDEDADEGDGEDEDTDDEDLSAMGESIACEAVAAEGKAAEGVSEGVAKPDFAVAGNGFEPSSEDDDVGSFMGF